MTCRGVILILTAHVFSLEQVLPRLPSFHPRNGDNNWAWPNYFLKVCFSNPRKGSLLLKNTTCGQICNLCTSKTFSADRSKTFAATQAPSCLYGIELWIFDWKFWSVKCLWSQIAGWFLFGPFELISAISFACAAWTKTMTHCLDENQCWGRWQEICTRELVFCSSRNKLCVQNCDFLRLAILDASFVWEQDDPAIAFSLDSVYVDG